VTIRATGRGAPHLFLRDGQKVATNNVGDWPPSPAVPLALASADFDEDGMPDLASGYAAPNGAGVIAIHRGNIDALWPYGKAPRNSEPPAFLPDARVFALPEAPDFLGAGDFDADGHWDLVAGHRGSKSLYFLRGDGHGGFAPPERIDLPDSLTALTTGEINRIDDRLNDLAVGAGNQLLVIHGRDRKLTLSKADRERAPAAEITRQTLPFAVRSLAAGRFTSTILDLAALGDDGKLHFLERPDADYQAARAELPLYLSSPNGPPRLMRRGTRDAQSLPKKPETRELVLRNDVALSETPGAAARLVTAHISITRTDDLILADGAANRLHIFSRSVAGERSMRLAVSLDTPAGSPAAVLPMRLHPSALRGLVVLQNGQAEPTVLLPRIANSYTVINTQDPGPSAFDSSNPVNTSVPGSLRWAISSADAAGGPAAIDFNIPVTDPNYNPANGSFTITVLPTTNCGIDPCQGLPPLPAGTIMDAYTQPGASANSLTNGDNAVIKIVISGAVAGIGPHGIWPIFGTSTIRGFNVSGFGFQPGFQPGAEELSGNYGINLEGSGNFIEGNFLGTDPTGSQANGNGDGTGGLGDANTVGGTTPQARNLLSGNNENFGAVVDSLPNTYFFQGNYVGTDHTGTVPLSIDSIGYNTNGANMVVGGTTAGAANLFSGNSIGVQTAYPPTNPFTPDANLIQGNLVGTDPTGTLSVFNIGGIVINAGTGNLIGGTTSAARNIVSGNGLEEGMIVNGTASETHVEGNYIGVDISGVKALPNLGAGIDHSLIKDQNGNNIANALGTIIGGEIPAAANVISGNLFGIALGGSGSNGMLPATIVGNLIGTDAGGVNPMPNGSGGIEVIESGANYVIGGTDAGAANVIAFNQGYGVLIDPAVGMLFSLTGGSNSVIGNNIFSNTGPGVWVHTSTGNVVSQNSIYSNGGLGIDIDALGRLVNSNCQSNTNGGNSLQNAPVLTAAPGGATLVSATATDPNGNTSEFSNCAAMANTGNTLNIAATLNSKPNTTYTVEFFQNAFCDPSGYGQGKTFLHRISVTTGSNCAAPISDNPTITTADVGVLLTYNHNQYSSTVHFATPFVYQGVVTNGGVANASGVTFSDSLPSSLILNSVSITQGTCNTSGNAVTCNIGTLPAGATAEVTLNVTINGSGTIANTATASTATANSSSAVTTSTVTLTSSYEYVSIDHFVPAAGTAGNGALPITIYGVYFYPGVTTVTANGTALSFTPGASTTCELDFVSYTCQSINATLPATLTASPGNLTIVIANPSPGGTTSSKVFTIYPNPGNVASFGLSGVPTSAVQNTPYNLVVTALDINGNVVPSYRGVITLGDSAGSETFTPASPYQFTASDNGVHTFITTFPYTESVDLLTVADAGTPSIMGNETLVVNPLLGAPAHLSAAITPDSIPIGYPFPQPVTAFVSDANYNALPGITVTFTVTPASNGASGTFSNGKTTMQAVSDSDGNAAVNITANLTAGGFGVTATVGSLSAQFGLGSTNLTPSHLTILNGEPTTAPIDTQINTSLGVLVTDINNNPVVEVPVNFSAPTSGATVNLASTTAVTASQSIFSIVAGGAYLGPVGVTNGIAGSYKVTASIGGLSVQFDLTNTSTPSTVAQMNTINTPQTTPVNKPFGMPLTAQAADVNDNCIAQVPITFSVPASGPSATLSATKVTSDVNCNATVTATANGIVGTYNVTATAPNGVSGTFAMTNNTGATTLNATYGTPQSTPINTAFGENLEATLLDLNGNPLTGQTVYFTAPATGATATLSAPSAITGPTGTAVVGAAANGNLGSYVVTASYGAAKTAFSLTNTLPPAQLSIQVSHSGTFAVGQAPVTYTVTVSNSANAGPTVGAVTVQEIVPTGLTLLSMAGTGWTCQSGGVTCVRNDALAPGASYPAIAVTVAVANNAPALVTNQASVLGGGSVPGNSTDLTSISSFNLCDINMDHVVNIKDVQLEINEALGVASPANDLDGDGVVNVVDVQIVSNGALGLSCAAII